MLLSMFISSYTIIYFCVKKFIFFEDLFFSEYDTGMSLYVFLLRKEPSVKYLRNWWWDGGTQNVYSCVQGQGGCHASGERTHLLYLFSCFWQHFCLILSCFICRILTLPLFKKDVFFRNGYFSPARSISVVMK